MTIERVVVADHISVVVRVTYTYTTVGKDLDIMISVAYIKFLVTAIGLDANGAFRIFR